MDLALPEFETNLDRYGKVKIFFEYQPYEKYIFHAGKHHNYDESFSIYMVKSKNGDITNKLSQKEIDFLKHKTKKFITFQKEYFEEVKNQEQYDRILDKIGY